VLRRKLSGVTLRRRKDEVLEQLPPRLDQDLYIEMTKRQKSLYHDVEAGLGKWVEGDEDEQMNPLARLTHLREICDSTALFRDDLFESCKLDELKPLVSELRDTRKKLIIFSAFERMTRMIEEALNKESHETLRVHGGVSSSKRAGIFDSFNSPDGPGILVMTDAGALGVNLQAAEVVVNFDLPFNPAILEQRIARAHRMGQLKSVNVLNLICQNSVEVGIRKLLRKKMELFREVVEGLDGPVAAASGGLRELCEFLLRNKTA